MAELFDFGRYAPYIAMTYGVSIVALGALVFVQWRKLKAARKAEKDRAKET